MKAYTYQDILEAREVYYGNLTGNKIAFGYDYADKDADIMPFNNSHGTHVAGIIAGYDSKITGVAIDAQLAIMKVFSDYDAGAEDGDILAALEDSVILGVDAINMSLGASCGFSREVDEDFKNQIYDSIEAAGISLVVAASNDYSSGFGSEEGNTNKTHNPDSATVGSPASYSASLAVASINGQKDKYMYANGEREVFFHEAFNMNSKEYDFFNMLGVNAENPTAEFEYVTIPGVGYAVNYSGLEMNGKIALVRRGDITFEEKVQFAYEAGAAAIIIYNNVFGDIMMTVGNDLKIPVVSIGKDDGEALAKYSTGVLKFDYENVAGPFMSDFSSWGPNPDLTLKPEITAHGGNILSSIIGGEYEEQSGTSMAAPNMCGITVLIRQHVKEKYPELSAAEVRDLVNQLCMSTATIALDTKGNAYSPRKQGAGIADIAKATTTPAYLYVDGIGKTKLELFDDPDRTGVYEMTINLKNISDKSVSYNLGIIAMTESVSTSDPEYVAEMAYILSGATTYSVSGGTLSEGVVTVAAGQTATVTAKLVLSDADKAYINSNFKNGMYVEGFLTFTNVEEKGVGLNAPFLAFYGDWGEAPIFDLDYYEVETEAHNNAIDDEDKIKADYYATTPLGTYYYDYILPLGSYVYKMDESEYTPIPATQEHAAVSYFADSISGIYGVFAGLLRGAKELKISIVDTATGKEVWSDTQYNCYKSHYNGGPMPYYSKMQIAMANYETGEVFGNNNTRYEVTMSAKLDWNGEERNSSDTYSFSFYIDYEAPSVVDATFRTEYDKSREENRYYVDIMVYDNHYAMSLRPVIVYDTVDEDGEPAKTYSSLTEYPIPIYQENRGEASKVTLEITDYLDIITNSAIPEGLTVYIDDYAMNSGVCYIPFPKTESDDLEFVENELELDIKETFDLATYLVHKDTADSVAAEPDYLRGLKWTSSDESVVAISDGKIEARKAGSATISVTGSTWVTEQTVGGQKVEIPIYKSIVVKVSDTVADVPKPQIESLKFDSYYTEFAFNSDIDYSEIGITGSTNYFGGNYSLSFYPSEKVKLNYALEPWNLPEGYTLKWSSSNTKVATVDENGVVTGESEGNARITLQITIDGKTSLLAARCSIEIKSEFIIENRKLVAYKGKGGDVVIPDDEGIMYIGAFAFCHFNLDNEIAVEKDENGYYDMDLKKEPLGNNTVTSVVIPEGVETIEKYAFYNCEALRSVQLPSTCKTVEKYAFANCTLLTNANLEGLRVISDYAFNMCESLTCDELGGVNLERAYAIGDYAFQGARFNSVKLFTLSRPGVGAFKDCKKLTDIELGKKTRISKNMFEGTPVKEIIIYSDVIQDNAFKNCTSLTSVQIKNDVTYLGVEAFSGCEKLSSVEFFRGCEEIADFAFSGCKALKTFALPDCSVAIGDGVFAASALKTLKLGKNTVIAENGIGVFDKVASLTVDASLSDAYKVADGVLYTKDGSVLVLLIPGNSLTSFTVPKDVKVIYDGAFSSNSKLLSVNFETGSLLESIGYGAFANCTSLKSVALPDRTVAIGESAFFNTSALTSINLEKVKSIGYFAFEGSAVSSIRLGESVSVVIGDGAFYGASNLKNVTIGQNAVIGAYAFAESSVQSVEFLGGGVTVGEAAFFGCTKLSSFDFDDLTGKVSDFAFYGCTSLNSVTAPEITEIGMAAFADCSSLQYFSAEKLVAVGDYAFSPYSESSPQGDPINTFVAPKLTTVGEYSFYMCTELESIDLSKVTSMGTTAFAYCISLESVTLSPNLEELADLVFYGCTALADINLDSVVRFGMGSVCGVQLPATLELTKAEYLDSYAFIESSTIEGDDAKHYVVSVVAPNLVYVGEQAFAGCELLDSVYAPKLEEIGTAAFAYTAIKKFEVFESLKTVGSNAFEGCDGFTSFFTKVEGAEVYDKIFESVMIKDGVLYSLVPNGYVLSSYPVAKTDKTFKIADGTVRIEFCAFAGNKSLERVEMPESMKFIGNFAFYECDNLKTVVFKSYYAPTLEGTMSGSAIEITPDNVADYPGFNKVYKYDYYFRMDDIVAYPLYYSTFIDAIATEKASGLTYVIPLNSKGYDSKIYKAYFKPAENENSGTVMGPYAIAFIEAVNKLPETADRFDKSVVDSAINAYNALAIKAEELKLVDESLIERFNKARTEYNVSVAENKIKHLFGMYNDEYSFELLKDARATYLALTDAERALVSNGTVIDAKVAELSAAMGKTVDFSISYAEHFVNDSGDLTPPDNPNASGKVAIIICASVLGAALIAAGVFFLLKAKCSKKAAVAKEGAAENNAEDEKDSDAE